MAPLAPLPPLPPMAPGAHRQLLLSPRAAHAPLSRAPDGSTSRVEAAQARLQSAVEELRPLQVEDGSIPEPDDRTAAGPLVERIVAGIAALAPEFPHDAAYLEAVQVDFRRWADGGFGVPDFLDSLVLFAPDRSRADGIVHLVVFPMYTQNGNPNRNVEGVLCSVLWPQWLADIEADLIVPERGILPGNGGAA